MPCFAVNRSRWPRGPVKDAPLKSGSVAKPHCTASSMPKHTHAAVLGSFAFLHKASTAAMVIMGLFLPHSSSIRVRPCITRGLQRMLS